MNAARITVRCVRCREPVLGAANRCWKCASPLDAESCSVPKTRRAPIPSEWLESDATRTAPQPETPPEAPNDEPQPDQADRPTTSPFAFVAEAAASSESASARAGFGRLDNEATRPASPFYVTAMFVLTATAAVSTPYYPWLGWMSALAVIVLAVIALRTEARRAAFTALLVACLVMPVSIVLYVRSLRIPLNPAAWQQSGPNRANQPVILDEE